MTHVASLFQPARAAWALRMWDLPGEPLGVGLLFGLPPGPEPGAHAHPTASVFSHATSHAFVTGAQGEEHERTSRLAIAARRVTGATVI